MRRTLNLMFFSFLFFGFTASAQFREIPSEVKEAFSKQYPDAESPEYKDMLVNVRVYFTQDEHNMMATFNNKGMWRETEKDWSFDNVPVSVKDGFGKSKYADWEITETKIVYRPGKQEYYRVRVAKSDLQKKYLYFNDEGRLVEDNITL